MRTLAARVLDQDGMAQSDDPTVARIDDFMQDLPQDDDSPEALIREHLDAARSYLLGSMPLEYQLNLKLARGVLRNIHDKDMRARLEDFLNSQQEPETGAKHGRALP